VFVAGPGPRFGARSRGPRQEKVDSNFWVATHVVTVTIGYSGTFLRQRRHQPLLVRGQHARGRPALVRLSPFWALSAFIASQLLLMVLCHAAAPVLDAGAIWSAGGQQLPSGHKVRTGRAELGGGNYSMCRRALDGVCKPATLGSLPETKNVKAPQAKCPQGLRFLVAGAGFEPATFGL